MKKERLKYKWKYETIRNNSKLRNVEILFLKKEIRIKLKNTLTEEEINDLFTGFDFYKYKQEKGWSIYGILLYCGTYDFCKFGIEYWLEKINKFSIIKLV